MNFLVDTCRYRTEVATHREATKQNTKKGKQILLFSVFLFKISPNRWSMPAEAELLCDYFLSSKLSSKKKSVEPISATAVLLKQQKLSTGSFTTNELNFDSIEFVKYEKNPMDYLKSKYTLLNGASTSTDTPPATKQTLKLQPTEAPEPAATAAAVKKKTAESTLIMNWSKLKRNGIGLLNIGKI